LFFLKKIQITCSCPSRSIEKVSDAKANKIRWMGTLHMSAVLLFMPPFMDPKGSPGRFLFKNERFSR